MNTIIDMLEALGLMVVIILDHIIPMKQVKVLFVDVVVNKPVFLFEERISGCQVMAFGSMSWDRVPYESTEEEEY